VQALGWDGYTFANRTCGLPRLNFAPLYPNEEPEFAVARYAAQLSQLNQWDTKGVWEACIYGRRVVSA
jgi:hypothetical protein